MNEELGEGVSVWRGDCLDILPRLPSSNHVLTDPPYEDELHEAVGKINRIRMDGRTVPNELGFDGVNDLRPEFAKAIVAHADGWALIFTLAEGVRAWRDDLQAYGAKYDTCCFWVKPDASPRFNGQGPSRGAECIVTAWCGKGYRSWNGGGKRGVFTHLTNAKDREGTHPTEKSLSLMCELVALFTNPGDLVCDPFGGTFTTGVACIRLGRRFVGIEKDKLFYEVGKRRLLKELAQPRMAFEPPPTQFKISF